MEKILIYRYKDIDVDGSEYYRFRNDVHQYRRSNNHINDIFDKYEEQISDASYYIIGNWFCFTLDGVKYRENLSSFADEYNYVDDIIGELSQHAQDVVYIPGRAD